MRHSAKLRPQWRPSAVLLCSSVGARRDGFVQLQGGGAELQAAVAAFADAAGLKQLLARHGDLLVAAAGTEDVTAVPAGDTHTVGASSR